jgi:Amt family ammonium transporter
VHYVIHRNQRDRYSTTVLCNGFLAGLVSITAGCNEVEPFAAFIIGILGGLTYMGLAKLLFRLKVDDPLEASPIHVGCGILGLISLSFFSTENGIFYGGGGKLLGVQILAIICISAWSIGNSAIFLLILRAMNILREDAKTEITTIKAL